MYGCRIEFRCSSDSGWQSRFGIYCRVTRDGQHSMAQPLVFKDYDADSPFADVEPMLRLDNDEAQSLMDELWRCGLRPSEGSGSAGSLAATQRHLADMQKIAFGALKLPEARP